MATAKKATAKKVKVEGPSNYKKNSAVYKLPMTPAQGRAFNKLYSSPKTADTLFTLPKGAEKLSVTEKSQMQKRRIADRKRTLARAEAIIRRTVGQPKIGGVNLPGPASNKPKPRPKSTPKPKSMFG